jgi:hypothetical protein
MLHAIPVFATSKGVSQRDLASSQKGCGHRGNERLNAGIRQPRAPVRIRASFFALPLGQHSNANDLRQI